MTDPAHTWGDFALLLIDAQNDFWSDDLPQHFPDFPASVVRLLTFCRAEGIEVIHLRALFSPNMSDWMVRYKLRKSIPCVAGTPGAEVLPFACDLPGEKVFFKQSFDGFLAPELLPYLQKKGVRFLLTAGLVTSTCVLLTTASAMQRGFLTAVVEDCCADEPFAHEHTLSSYRFIFDRTRVDLLPTHAETWRQHLRAIAALQPG